MHAREYLLFDEQAVCTIKLAIIDWMMDCGKRMPMKHSYSIQNEIGLIIVILDKQRICLTLMSLQTKGNSSF